MNEISVSKIFSILFSNIFSLIIVFILGFALSSFFSEKILEKKYSSLAYMQLGEVKSVRIGSLGALINQINSTSINLIFRENYDVPPGSDFSVKRSKEDDSLAELKFETLYPEDILQIQNSFLLMIRALQEDVFQERIQEIIYKIKYTEVKIKETQAEIIRLKEKIKALPLPTGGESGALVTYVEIAEVLRQKQLESKKVLQEANANLTHAKRSSFLTSPKPLPASSFSYPNSRTHLGFALLVTLIFILGLLLKEFRSSST